MDGRFDRRAAGLRGGVARTYALARGLAIVHRADGRAEPAARRDAAARPASSARTARPGVRAVPAARRASPPARRDALRRRAADARARPRADERAEALDARRAK